MSDYISRDKVAQAFEDADVDVCESLELYESIALDEIIGGGE